ncbi:uncharacterized protein A4U43_C06F10710 [Asparagus officinalis]|uniref:Uncharacterized protein n=1 Tax=Asparagus officinalis TaxID=4686 RepID=A0A5P1EKY9_ASPOF|nr:uncharacterized protein A4U43_C06F10710 [Asparagus officinalis]
MVIQLPQSHRPSCKVDVASLTAVGPVNFNQILKAAAAYKKVVVCSLASTMSQWKWVSLWVVFLPSRKVKEKAKRLRSSLTANILSSSGSPSKNILAMTFRQVVLQTLWSYKLSFFSPGTERDMEHLANPREVLPDFTVSSSDKRFLSELAEALCSCTLESTKRFYLKNMGGLPSGSVFGWSQKPSVDSSICVHRLSEGEITKIARKQTEKFDLVKEKSAYRQKILNHRLWEPLKFSQLNKFGGPGFSEWVNEFVPAYSLQIDASVFKDAKLEGWQELSNNRWEVLLTHFQMVELVSILDMHYEDQYTLPDKELSCGLTTQSPIISKKKNSLWKLLFVSMAGGCILIFVSFLAQIYWPTLLKARKVSVGSSVPQVSETYMSCLKSLEAVEVEALCKSVIEKIKDELCWSGDIMFDKIIGAWIGKLPSYLKERDILLNSSSAGELFTNCSNVDSQSHTELTTNVSGAPEADNLAMPTTAQEVASYQVVMSGDGKVIGFQPTSRVAVNHWASNPLSKLLYGGRKLSPGILEPSLKIPHPSEVVLIELLMSVNPESRFALARPMQ